MSEIQYEVTRESLSDQAYRFIKNSILNGSLRGGERVPEVAIARRFGLSRTPIRDALRRLAVYGLVNIKPRSYAEVVSLTPDEAEDVAQLRAALETLAIRQLVERASEKDVVELTEIVRNCDAALSKGDVGQTFEYDSHFHLEIARRSGNRHLFEVSEKADAKVQLLRLVLHLPTDKLSFFISQHWDILRCVRTRNAHEAERVMRNHVLDQLQFYEPRTSMGELLPDGRTAP